MMCILKTGQGCFNAYVLKKGWYALLTPIAITLLFFLSLSGFFIIGNGRPAYAGLFINEFMALNSSTIEDPEDPNSYEDWIEIYNSGNSAVPIGGMYITDDLTNPTKWRIPAGLSIPPKGYLLFWTDNDDDQGQKHTNFRLSADGEEIGLFNSDGATLVDSIVFGAQLTDISYGRYPDGGTDWGFMSPTPDAANGQHNAPPVITKTAHSPLLPAAGDAVWVTCAVTDDGSVSSVTLTYNSGSGFNNNVPMLDNGSNNDGAAGDGIFGAKISAAFQTTGAAIDYYITALDNLGVKFTDPVGAPASSYCYIVGYTPPSLFINEFMADNKGTIEDPDDPNSYEDWIEIYNAGVSSVDAGGMFMSDNMKNPAKWLMPPVIIPAGGFLFILADNEEDQALAAIHAGFKLSKEGGEIGLFDTVAKRNMTIDKMIYGKQQADASCGRMFDGVDPWVISGNSTPGYSNAFPAGRCTMIWTFSFSTGSLSFIKDMGGFIQSIDRITESSGKRESAYIFWGRASGKDFSIEQGGSYVMTMTSPFVLP
ncbi:lamin tail domain-containing protein [bacterium]|nr:lamin tail domain-containing protein [bacterium]